MGFFVFFFFVKCTAQIICLSNGYKNSERRNSVWADKVRKGFRGKVLNFDPGEQEEDMTDGGRSVAQRSNCVEGLLGSRRVTLVYWGQFWKTHT